MNLLRSDIDFDVPLKQISVTVNDILENVTLFR